MKTQLFVVFSFVILCLVFFNWKTIVRIVTEWSITKQRAASHTFVFVESVILDDIIWPLVMSWQGDIVGGLIIMPVITLLNNLILIHLYDSIKKDLLVFETLRELTEREQKGIGKRLLAWCIKMGKVPGFIAISFWDPFLSVIYMRKGAGNYKMERRDWVFFVLAMVIACIGWTSFWKIGFLISNGIAYLCASMLG